jgi:hemerythrin-like metal-binding protein
MALIEWQDTYSVGVDKLDDDHKRLINIIKRIDEAEKSGKSVQWALEELKNYAECHFRAEEECMNAADYPGIDEQKQEHRAFVEWLASVERTYNLSPDAHFHLAETVNDYLSDWLRHHILVVDMQYKGCLEPRRNSMRAKDIMTSRVATVNPSTTVIEIAKLLLERGISAVPVVDDNGTIVGIVSEGDLIHREEIGTAEKKRSWWLRMFTGGSELAENYIRSHGHSARDVMTRDVVSVGEDAVLTEIAEILEMHRIKRVPVVRDGKLIGIVSRANFIQAIAASKEIRLEPVNADDASIGADVESALKREGWAGSSTKVTVTDRTVKLWGWVRNDAERTASRVVAEGVAGVASVEDRRIAQPDTGLGWT